MLSKICKLVVVGIITISIAGCAQPSSNANVMHTATPITAETWVDPNHLVIPGSGYQITMRGILAEHDQVLVVYFVDWCSACQEYLPMLNDLVSEVQVIAIAPESKQAEVEQFKKEYGLLYPIYAGGSVPPMLIGWPHTIIYRGEYAVWHGVGVQSIQSLRDLLKKKYI